MSRCRSASTPIWVALFALILLAAPSVGRAQDEVETPVEVRLPDVREVSGASFRIPLGISAVTGRDIQAIEITLRYDSDVVLVEGIVTEGTLADGWNLVSNITSGRVQVAMASVEPLAGIGVLLYLNCSAGGGSGASTTISFEKVVFNEGNPPSIGHGGTVSIVNTPPTTVPDSMVTEEDVAVTISVLQNDSDANADALTVMVVSQPSNGSAENNGDGTVTYTPEENFNGVDNFTYTVSDGNDGTIVENVNVIVTAVNDAPTISPIANPASIPENAGQQTIALSGISSGAPNENQTLTITATSNNTALILTPAIDYASPNVSGSVQYTPVPNAFGSAILIVTVKDNGGTEKGGVDTVSQSFTIIVTPAPLLADFSASPTNGTTSLSVNFTDISTGNISSWQWEFGDGATSSQQHPDHTYTNNGTFTVRLTVNGPGGSNTKTIEQLITVNQASSGGGTDNGGDGGEPPTPPIPVADFDLTPSIGKPPLAVEFTDRSSGNITSRVWDFGDGEISNELNPTHTYIDIGVFTVTLTVFGPGGESNKSQDIHVVENLSPKIENIAEQEASWGEPLSFDVPVIDDQDSADQINIHYRPITKSRGLIESVKIEGQRVTVNPFGKAEFTSEIIIFAIDRDGAQSDVVSVLLEWIKPLDTQQPVISEIQVTDIRTTSAQIAWRTDEVVVGYVRYGIQQGNLTQTASVAEEVRAQHSIALRNLIAGTTYFFQAVAVDPSGNERQSDVRNFTTLRTPDVIPPIFVSGPLVRARDSSAVVQWRTNEPVTAVITLDATVGSSKEFESLELKTEHSMVLKSLLPSTAYHLVVVATDAAKNEQASRTIVFVTTAAADTIAPNFIQLPGASPAHDRAVIAWEIDEPGTCVVQYGLAGQPRSFADSTQALALSWSVTLSSLVSKTEYAYVVTCWDLAGNSVSSGTRSFRTLAVPDITAPIIVEGPSVTGISHNESTIVWKTDEQALSYVLYDSIAISTGAFETSSHDAAITHRHRVTNLNSGIRYQYRAVSVDLSGNADTSAVDIFRTRVAPDTIKPKLISRPALLTIGFDRISVAWETDEISTSEAVATRLNASVSDSIKREIFELVKSHQVSLTGLASGTTYGIVVRSKDGAGNLLEVALPDEIRTASAPDTTAPHIVGLPLALGVSNTRAQVVWETDELADGFVEIDTLSDFSTVRRYGATEQSLRHQTTLTNLNPATTYYYFVFSQDALGNGPTKAPSNKPRTFTTSSAPDTLAPVIIWGPVSLAPTESSAQIQWGTDELADGRILLALSEDAVLDGQQFQSTQLKKEHAITLTSLLPDTTYYYRVFSVDEKKNGPVASGVKSFRTLAAPDTLPPVIVAGPSAINITATNALIGWTTDEPANSEVVLGGIHVSRSEAVVNHQVLVANLLSSTTYGLTIYSTDAAGNQAQSIGLPFTTATERDTIPPVIFVGPTVTYASDIQATISWETDEPATSTIEYSEDFNTRPLLSVVSDKLVRSHHLTITGLVRDKRYQFRVISADVGGNEVVAGTLIGFVSKPGVTTKLIQSLGNKGSFTTALMPDTAMPIILSGPHAIAITSSSLTLEWETDESSDSSVRFQSNGVSVFSEDGQDVHQHRMVITNLTPGQTYQYQVASVDPAGNGPAQSRVFKVKTLSVKDETPPRIVDLPHEIDVKDVMATIAWKTNEGAQTYLEYGTSDIDKQIVLLDFTTKHEVILTRLSPNVTYQYRVQAIDSNGNGPTKSPVRTFVTRAIPDAEPPEITEEPKAVVITNTSATIRWKTNELSGSVVHYTEMARTLGRCSNLFCAGKPRMCLYSRTIQSYGSYATHSLN